MVDSPTSEYWVVDFGCWIYDRCKCISPTEKYIIAQGNTRAKISFPFGEINFGESIEVICL
jgi:hypothetical protein